MVMLHKYRKEKYMELWIRSQDKMALAKFDLCILEKYPDKYIFIADHYKNMGTYSTKERALEVLDEIQKCLSPRGILKQISGKLGKGKFPNDYKLEIENMNKSIVYEMLEE